MTTIKYLLDENVDPIYRTSLLKIVPRVEVRRSGDPGAPAIGTPDPEILLWCEKYEYILVTNNRRSMPDHITAHLDEGRHFPGILILNEEMSLSQTIDDLALIWGASDMEEYQDTLQYLPVRGLP